MDSVDVDLTTFQHGSWKIYMAYRSSEEFGNGQGILIIV
jgi:hypothetical protein